MPIVQSDLVVCAGFDVYLEPEDLDEKVADLHFLALSNTRCGTHCPHPYQASSGSIRLPRLSPCDRVGFRPTAKFWVDVVFLHGPSAGAV